MSTADTTQTAAADDTRGRHIAVRHVIGHVCIDVGADQYQQSICLTVEAARVIINGMADAVTDARLWQIEQAAAADTAAELEELEQIKQHRQPTDVYLPITYDAHDTPHIRRPHTTYAGAWRHAEELAASDLSIVRFEIATMEMIEDAEA